MESAQRTVDMIRQIGKYIDVNCSIIAPSLSEADHHGETAHVILTMLDHVEELFLRLSATVQIIVLDGVGKRIPVDVLEMINGLSLSINSQISPSALPSLAPSLQCIMATSLWADTRVSSIEQLGFIEIMESPVIHPLFALDKFLMCRIIDIADNHWKNDTLLDLLGFRQTKQHRIKSRIYFDSIADMGEASSKLRDVINSPVVCIDGSMDEEVRPPKMF